MTLKATIPAGKSAAIACTLAAVAFFASLDTTTKVLASAVPVVLVVWFRYLFQVLLTVAMADPARRRQLHRSQRPGLQVLRGATLITATVIAFYSLKFMPVAEFTAVVTLTPLFVTLLAVWRRRPSFARFSFAANQLLMYLGALLLLMQLHGYLHDSDPDSFRFPEQEHRHLHEDMDLEKTVDSNRNTL